MLNLRNALAGGDGHQISQARAAVESAKGQSGAAAEMGVNLSDAARGNALSMIQLLSTSQYAKYIAIHADEIPDAADILVHGLDEARQGNDKDFVSLRDQLTDEVHVLVFGVGAEAHPNLCDRVKALLDRARGMNNDKFQAERADLQQSARKIIASHQARTDLQLEHWVANQMARLLSNPELSSAIVQRIRASKSAS